MYESVNPATGESFGEYAGATDRAVDEALGRSASAYSVWVVRSVPERSGVARRVADLIEERADDLAPLVTRAQ